MSARPPITDAFVRNVRRPDLIKRQITYIDTLERGLALLLVVSYGGTKTFRVLTYHNGKARTRKLGTYPALSVKEARAQAREYWQNPSKVEAKAAVGTFKEVADNWIKRYVDLHKLRSKHEIERILDKHLYPEWADRPFLEIRRGEVNKLLDKVIDADSHRKGHQRKNQGRSQADAVLAVLRAIMRLAMSALGTFARRWPLSMIAENAPSAAACDMNSSNCFRA